MKFSQTQVSSMQDRPPNIRSVQSVLLEAKGLAPSLDHIRLHPNVFSYSVFIRLTFLYIIIKIILHISAFQLLN